MKRQIKENEKEENEALLVTLNKETNRASYLLFTIDVRASFIAAHPGLSNSQIRHGIAELWSQQNDSQKAAFESRVRKLLALAMKSSVPPPVEEYSNDTKKRKRDPFAPKKPPTAYLLFSAVRRAQLKQTQPNLFWKDHHGHQGIFNADTNGYTAWLKVMKEIDHGWKLLDAKERATYESAADTKKTE